MNRQLLRVGLIRATDMSAVTSVGFYASRSARISCGAKFISSTGAGKCSNKVASGRKEPGAK